MVLASAFYYVGYFKPFFTFQMIYGVIDFGLEMSPYQELSHKLMGRHLVGYGESKAGYETRAV